MESFNKYPKLANQFEKMCQTRRNEILTVMLETDDKYKKLCSERRERSVSLKEAVVNTEADVLFNQYSDAIYAQDVYELDSIYRHAVNDTLTVLEENGFI